MNQIGFLSEKKFRELSLNELIIVFIFYCDENKYEYNENEIYNLSTIRDFYSYFESTFFNIIVLRAFFNYWTK